MNRIETNIIALPTLDGRRLAADYCEILRDWLGEDWTGDPNDQTDVNEAMLQAVRRQWGNSWSLNEAADAMNAAFARAADHNHKLRRVLVACEFSGVVRDAFAAHGHSVLSSDLLETEQPGPHHVGDVREVMNDGFGTMLAFPPCTYLCSSGWFRTVHDKTGERMAKHREAVQFVKDLFAASPRRKCLENPVGKLSTLIRKPEQIVNPYQFGHDVSKRTCLWLDNLEPLPLDPEQYVAPRLIEYKGKTVKRWGNQSPCGADNKPQSANRWRERSRTFPGIGHAFAANWGATA